MQLTFLGGTRTVTGSKYLVTEGDAKVLVDCGLFQGYKQLRLRNWGRPPIAPATLSGVILTHAHLDHIGYLPLLVKHGFGGKIYCSEATNDLCKILLPDSGRLQEEEAEYANRRGYSKHTRRSRRGLRRCANWARRHLDVKTKVHRKIDCMTTWEDWDEDGRR